MHINILQGASTGGVELAALHLTRVVNANSIGDVLLDYVSLSQLNLTRVVNAQSFGAVDLEDVVVSELNQTRVTNSNTINGVNLQLVPFVPANTETTTLLAAMTGTYSTTAKRQMDALITELKSGGQWAEIDWYGNAYWAVNEHDALLNWKNPSQTLVKVGSAFWTAGVGLTGVNPATSSGRYKSGYNVGDGNSTSTSFAMFAKVTSIFAPQNGMQLMGNFEYSSPGPSAPDGSFIFLNVPTNTGSAGANVLPFNGNTGYAIGDGTGLWGTSRSGGTNITVHDASQVDSDSVSGTATYHNAEGICVVGTPPGFNAQRSFGGTVIYWGWGAAMSAAHLSGLETAFQTALLPPTVGGGTDSALGVDDTGDYLSIDGTDFFDTGL